MLDSSVDSSQSTLDAWREVGAASDGSALLSSDAPRWWEETREGARFEPSLPLSERGSDAVEERLWWLEEGVSDLYSNEALLPESLLVADLVYLLLGSQP